MIGLLLLASVGRCAVPTLCPSDAEIIAAVRSRDSALVQEVSDQAASEGQVVILHPQPIRRVSEVICGDRLPGETLAITCKFTVRYARHNAYQVAKLVRRNEAWEVMDAFVVMRNRR